MNKENGIIKLKDIIYIIWGSFELYKGDRIGTFTHNDIGVKEYLEDQVLSIQVESETLHICLDY